MRRARGGARPAEDDVGLELGEVDAVLREVHEVAEDGIEADSAQLSEFTLLTGMEARWQRSFGRMHDIVWKEVAHK